MMPMAVELMELKDASVAALDPTMVLEAKMRFGWDHWRTDHAMSCDAGGICFGSASLNCAAVAAVTACSSRHLIVHFLCKPVDDGGREGRTFL